MPVALGLENAPGKVNILIQSYVSRVSLENFSLVSDQAFVAQVRFFCNLHTFKKRKNSNTIMPFKYKVSAGFFLHCYLTSIVLL